MKPTSIGLVAGLIALPALAHENVKNPDVLARMDGMKTIAGAMKPIGQMAKGATEFDLDEVEVALARIETEARRVPELFAPEVVTPASEALPVLWEEFDEFSTKAAELEEIAADAQGASLTPDDLPDLIMALGQTCRDCHGSYRE